MIYDKYEVTWVEHPGSSPIRHFTSKATAEDFARNMRADPAIKKLELWGVRRTLLIEENPTIRARQEEA